MRSSDGPGPGRNAELAPAYAAVRARLALVAALLATAALGWVWTAQQMRGMDAGPWTSLGSFGWFLGIWVVMMTAMMFPSMAPTIALYARLTKATSRWSAWLFSGGYLLSWATAGVIAYAVGAAAAGTFGDTLRWDHAGRGAAAGTLLLAAAYEVTPLKNVCLTRCRSPLGALLGSWREGPTGALRMGARNGIWCVGCCWALMASMFALGVMSVTWMAFVAALIAVEKTLPWRGHLSYATAAVLLGLGVLMLVAPHALPGLTIPSGQMMPQG